MATSQDAGRWNIVIIGAGIGGLATAISLAQKTSHSIRILERSPELKEVGAGVQITPNASRIIHQWGLNDEFEQIATVPDFMEMRRYTTDEIIGLVPGNKYNYADRVWCSPHWLVHRVDYQRVLANAAQSLGVIIDLDAKVIHVDVEQLTIHTESGSTIHADFIIGADGIHSRTRQSIPALSQSRPIRAVKGCYRALIPKHLMQSNPLTAPLLSTQNQMCWAGHLRHIIGYRIANGSYYNLVIVVPDESISALLASYTQPGNPDEMRREFTGWHDTVTALLSLADSCTKWTLAELPPLPTWRTESGRIVLLGDAAHAMTPHAASGAAMTLEDAEVLGQCIATCTSLSALPSATASYEYLRKPRCERVQKMASDNALVFCMPDGPAQQARDVKWMESKARVLAELSDKDKKVSVPKPDMYKPFPHPEVVMWLYGHDAKAEAERYLSERAS